MPFEFHTSADGDAVLEVIARNIHFGEQRKHDGSFVPPFLLTSVHSSPLLSQNYAD